MKEKADQVSGSQAADIVEHDHQQDDPPAGKQFVRVGGDDDEDDDTDGKGGQGGQITGGPFRRPGPDPFHDQAEHYGQDNHPEDAQQHADDIDIHRFPGQQPHQQGSQYRGQQCGRGRHAD